MDTLNSDISKLILEYYYNKKGLGSSDSKRLLDYALSYFDMTPFNISDEVKLKISKKLKNDDYCKSIVIFVPFLEVDRHIYLFHIFIDDAGQSFYIEDAGSGETESCGSYNTDVEGYCLNKVRYELVHRLIDYLNEKYSSKNLLIHDHRSALYVKHGEDDHELSNMKFGMIDYKYGSVNLREFVPDVEKNIEKMFARNIL